MDWKKLISILIVVVVSLILILIIIGLEDTLMLFVKYHKYMISLVLPESLIIWVFWDFESNRAKNPFNKKYMSTITFVTIGAIGAIIGYFIISPLLKKNLTSFYLKYINHSFFTKILISSWFVISIPVLPLIMFCIASPAGIENTFNSFKKNYIED